MDRKKARKKATELVSQMTLEEKASQLRYDAPAIKRLGIPAYNWWNEALHGVARAGQATIFPQAIGLGATFDTELLGQIADTIATEGRAKYNAYSQEEDRDIYKGLTFWSPNVNIFRDPRWGRGHETYGEDPYLTNSTTVPGDEFLASDGRIMDSMLSEHMCEGWLEGYLLTGRHGFFASYESFIRVVDSMVAQHAKWLKVCNQLPWRQSIASLNLILSSNVWQQDHNGYTHQDPGFLDHIANKKADVVRLYLPPDANCLLSCFDHCIRSRDYVNVLVTSKHPRPQWLTMEQAVKHCTQGVGIWEWASNDAGQEPDVVMACCGDTPTLETLAAVSILRKALPELKIRVVNVVDLMKLEPATKHPHGLTDADYDALFTKDKPIIFAFHGYPTLIHELTYDRVNRNLSVHGYQEEGTITTPFDMRVQNEVDRFHLVKDAIQHLPQLGNRGAYLIQQMNDKLVEHKNYIHEVGQDLPEILDWKWES